MEKWFLYINEKISGPFKTNEIIELSKHNDLNHYYIWSKNFPEWKTFRWWKSNYKSAKKNNDVVKKLQIWHYAYNAKSFGPYSRRELVKELKLHNDFEKILIWTDGLSSWVPFFEFSDLMNEVGVNKRKHKRTSIIGKILITVEDNLTTYGELTSISEGGCGIQGVSILRNNQKVKVKIDAPALHNTILADAEVRYISQDGYIGLRFEKINTEARADILSYINSKVAA